MIWGTWTVKTSSTCREAGCRCILTQGCLFFKSYLPFAWPPARSLPAHWHETVRHGVTVQPSLRTMSEFPARAKILSWEAGRRHTASPLLVNSWIQFLIKSHPVITRVHCRWLDLRFVRRKDKKGKRPPSHLPGVLTMYNIARWRSIKKGLLHLSFSTWIETYFPFSWKQASAV